MRVFKKSGVLLLAAIAVSALSASSASANGTGSGSIQITSPTSITCAFTFSYTGNGPDATHTPPQNVSTTGANVVLGAGCPSDFTINAVALHFVGTGATADIDVTVDAGLWDCDYVVSGLTGGTVTPGGTNWTYTKNNASISGSGFICPTATADAVITGMNA